MAAAKRQHHYITLHDCNLWTLTLLGTAIEKQLLVSNLSQHTVVSRYVHYYTHTHTHTHSVD